MILLITDRPTRFSGIGRAIGLKSIRLIRPDPQSIRQILSRREEEPHAVLCDLGAAGASPRPDVAELRRCFGDLVPFVIVFDHESSPESAGPATDAGASFGVSDLIALADQGFAHFRSVAELFGSGIDAYLYRLIQQYESRQIIQGVRSFFIDQVVRDELVRTHGLLDALESGAMIVTPAFKNQDYLIHNVNDMLEVLFESNLRSFENRTLGELTRSPEVREEVRAVFRVDLNTILETGRAGRSEHQSRRSMLLPFGAKHYVERVISPFFQPDGNLAGFVFLFQDMTFEVERGLIDRVTGLVGRDQLERDLSRRMRRMELYGGLPCEQLAAILVKIQGLEPGDDFGARAGTEAIEYVLRKAAQGLKQSVRNAGVVSQNGPAEFLVAIPGMPLEGVCEAAHAILERMREIHIQAFGPIRINAGIAHHALPPDFSAAGDLERDLRTIEHELVGRIDEVRRALRRAEDAGPNTIVVYTRSGGYVTL